MRKSYYYAVAAMFMTMSFSGCYMRLSNITKEPSLCYNNE